MEGRSLSQYIKVIFSGPIAPLAAISLRPDQVSLRQTHQGHIDSPGVVGQGTRSTVDIEPLTRTKVPLGHACAPVEPVRLPGIPATTVIDFAVLLFVVENHRRTLRIDRPRLETGHRTPLFGDIPGIVGTPHHPADHHNKGLTDHPQRIQRLLLRILYVDQSGLLVQDLNLPADGRRIRSPFNYIIIIVGGHRVPGFTTGHLQGRGIVGGVVGEIVGQEGLIISGVIGPVGVHIGPPVGNTRRGIGPAIIHEVTGDPALEGGVVAVVKVDQGIAVAVIVGLRGLILGREKNLLGIIAVVVAGHILPQFGEVGL